MFIHLVPSHLHFIQIYRCMSACQLIPVPNAKTAIATGNHWNHRLLLFSSMCWKKPDVSTLVAEEEEPGGCMSS